MRQIITTKKIKLQLLLFVLLIISFASNAQLVEKWVSRGNSFGASFPAKNVITIAPDGNIISTSRRQMIKFTPDGDTIWTVTFTFPEHHNPLGISVAVDATGAIYLTSAFAADVNISFGDIDIFVAKYSADGKELWSKSYNSPAGADDESVGLGIDQFGNVYVTGNISISEHARRIHTIKFNTDGALQWEVTYPDGLFSHANAIAVDFFTGDVYVVGSSLVGKIGDDNHFNDFTTIKYNTNGVQQWVTLYNGNPPDFSVPDDEASSIALDADGNIFVTGFATESYQSNTAGTQGDRMFATFKYDRTDGHQIWKKTFGRSQSDGDGIFNQAHAIAVDGEGNVIVTGSTHGFEQWATVKYRNSDGQTIWFKTFDNDQFVPRNDLDDGFDEAIALAVDGSNNVYVTGYSKRNQTFQDFLTIRYKASNGDELASALFGTSGDDQPAGIAVDARGNIYITGQAGDFTTLKYGLCAIVCPQAITVNNEPGKCGAIVNFEATTTGDCGPLVFLEGNNPVTSGSFFSVGQHTILVKSESTGETCSFVITVVDNEKPIITQCPAALTVSCTADVPLADISLVKATDNCEVVTISHAGDVISNQTCANRFTLTRTYIATDSHGNTAGCTQIITVNDIVPPQITGFSLSKESLFPPNHSMQDITLNYQVLDNCVSNTPVKITITSNEPVNGTGDGDTDPDWIVVDDHHVQLRAERSAIGNSRIYTITVTADDGCNPPVSVTKQVFVAHNITAPLSGNPFKIGSTVNLAGTFWDKAGNKHIAKWLLDGSTAANGTVTEPSGNQNGKVTGSYKFNTAGVYKLQMNVTDQTGATSFANTNGDLEAIVVIYDPNGGYTYGGGYFNSPAGALVSNPSATGKTSYGFAVNYKNTSKPQGETQFEFKVGSFEFNALNFDYLVINGAIAQFKGTGKITGGQSGIGFTMTVKDGALDGSGIDKIRMKIYNKITGAVIYDNQSGASDAALPVTTVGSNSVIVIQGNNINAAVTNTTQENLSEDKATVDGLTVSAYPNPTKNYFTISVNSNSKEEIMMQVFDQNGRTMDIRRNMIPGSVTRFGDKYVPGAYYASIMQGKEHKEIKLIKITD